VIEPILPGATVGVLGSGQLGRMFAIAARRMGYRVHTLSPDEDTPTGQVADLEIKAAYDDLDAVSEFARNVSVVTFEFENVPAPTAEAAGRCAPVRPSGSVLHTTQQRIREKSFLTKAGLPTTPYREVRSLDGLQRALADLGCPAVLKTAAFGYDGKGQFRIESDAPDRVAEAWAAIGKQQAVLEAFIDFDCEISVVAARGEDGQFGVAQEAVELSRCVLEELDVVGVLCVEFFVAHDGSLLINELAPRPHNSGHLTVDACITSQFEQQLRAVCGLPLGSTEMHRPAAMANLLGDLWANGEPDWRAACAFPGVKLHLYGKLEPRPGRKMGHLTALNSDPEEAYRTVLAARDSLLA
jgi:5-(carboxyamino)imidazole ribonucleotide synthase